MRGTKHDASQHQRRGIRSRLIASVAAVAMLATSIAAGTAVAADTDETDPPQQNTIVEQPQQGTENAGDQTGEQNTESEGEQTTPSQEPGDTATEAESDNTAEADSTEEADPKADADKADDNQPQGAADNGQTVEKQSAQVPAPLAANAAADSGVSAQAEENGDSITVNMFDYTCQNKSGDDDCKVWTGSGEHSWWQPGNLKAYTSGINEGHDFKFLYDYKNTGKYNQWYESERNDTWNVWTDTLEGNYRDSRYPGIVQDTLQGGSPVLNVGSRESLSYLFNPQSEGNGVTDIRRNVQGLIAKGSDGYYEYNSDKKSATLSNEGEGNTVSLGEKTGKFMPFGTTDQYFGMTVESRFYMPEGGMVGSDPMKFEFSGDDDVWVFIDDQLVLDLGGIHDKVSGSIDFSTGEVVTLDTNGNQTSKTNLLDTFGSDWKSELSGKRHTLKMFYLERGGDASNCKIRFNMPQVPSDQIQIAKRVTGAATQEDLGRNYKFKVYVDYDGAGPQPEQLYTGGYTVNGNHVDTDVSGVIRVPANQQAVLDEKFSQDDSVTYRVVELSASTGGFTVSANDADGQSLETTADSEGTATASVSVADSPLVTVVNTKPLGVPDHSKKIGDNGDGTYTLALDVIGQNSEETQVTTIPLDIVLVLDTSGSMDNSSGHDMGYSYTPVYKDKVETWGKYYIDVNGQWTRVRHGNQGWYYGDSWDPTYVDYARYEGDTSNGRVQFYTRSDRQMSRMEALQNAADGFVESVAALNDGIADEGQRHRVAVVKFASDESDKIGNDTTSQGYNYSQVVSDLTAYTSRTVSQITTDTIDELYGEGATQADFGLHQAQRVLNGEGSLKGARENAKKVVIFFTDGEPTTFDTWSNSVAGGAINYAHDMKASGALVYSIGVFQGAKPDDTSGNFNKYMNAVSSNYPDAECTDGQGNRSKDFSDLKLGDRASGDAEYYFAAKNAEELDAVFEGIQSSITTGASYSNVAIVDELSQWAQVAHPDDFADHATLTVEKPSAYDEEGNVTGWTEVRSGETGYPSDYQITYTPASDDDTTTGTVRVDFPEDYKLQNGWRYTLTFDVEPTDQAYSDYAENNGKYPADQSTDSGQTEGAEGTDLYTDESNTPAEGGVSNTSVGEPGFHSNKQAYVEYTSAGKTDQAPYDHPVLQVDVTPVTIGSQFGLQEKKTVIGDSASPHVFDFTVTATGNNAKAAAELAGWKQCSEGQSDRCYVMSDEGDEAVYSFSNPQGIKQGEPAVVRSAGGDDGVKFTPDMAGMTFTYVYEESDKLPGNWHNQSEVPVWTVTATVGFTGDGKALQVTVKVYHGEGASGKLADTYVYTGNDLKPTYTGNSGEDIPTVSFTNAYVAPVSSLPLTGGSSTARTLLLAGGGVLLVAGAAWLLARRRRV